MRTPSKFPARHAIRVGIPRLAISAPFVFPVRRNGATVTEIMRPASPILIGQNPVGHPVMPSVLLVLTGPAGLSVPQGPVAGKVSGAGWTSPGRDRSWLWLRNAAAGLCVLAAAAASVSFAAQYRMVDATRHLPVVAVLEAAIPDTAALVFACLGIALALHGRRALRARALKECPVAPGRRAPAPGPAPAPPPRKVTKTARFLAMATERHGSFASIPLDAVAAISADLA